MTNLLKLLLPNSTSDQRRRELRIYCAAIVLGLVVGAVIVLVMISKNKMGG